MSATDSVGSHAGGGGEYAGLCERADVLVDQAETLAELLHSTPRYAMIVRRLAAMVNHWRTRALAAEARAATITQPVAPEE